jgi:hypothetical protein
MTPAKDRCCREPRPADCPPRKPLDCPPGVAPFGGPASGLWPSGSSFGQTSLASCLGANLFSECFQGCNNPGNCGWQTVIGSVVFTGQNVLLDPNAGAAVIFKSFSGVPAQNVTLQVRFKEIAGVVEPTMAYGMGALDAAGMGIAAVQLRGDGTVFVQIGGIAVYNGTWTPQGNGAFHTVVLNVAADGTPTLFIDQVLIPLLLGGAPMPAPFGPAIAFSVINFGGTPQGPATLFSIFLARGIYPPTTVFCCPNGQPPR